MKGNMRRRTSERVALTALGTALICIATRVFQIPIPLGYAHLGNCVILLFAVYFDPVTGGLSAALGSALADLLSFPVWALPTLLIKGVMGAVCAVIAKKRGEQGRIRSVRALLACLAAIGIMVSGYFLAGSFLYGSFAAGAAQIPGLALEGVVGIGLFYALAAALEAAGTFRRHHGMLL